MRNVEPSNRINSGTTTLVNNNNTPFQSSLHYPQQQTFNLWGHNECSSQQNIQQQTLQTSQHQQIFRPNKNNVVVNQECFNNKECFNNNIEKHRNVCNNNNNVLQNSQQNIQQQQQFVGLSNFEQFYSQQQQYTQECFFYPIQTQNSVNVFFNF